LTYLDGLLLEQRKMQAISQQQHRDATWKRGRAWDRCL